MTNFLLTFVLLIYNNLQHLFIEMSTLQNTIAVLKFKVVSWTVYSKDVFSRYLLVAPEGPKCQQPIPEAKM